MGVDNRCTKSACKKMAMGASNSFDLSSYPWLDEAQKTAIHSRCLTHAQDLVESYVQTYRRNKRRFGK